MTDLIAQIVVTLACAGATTCLAALVAGLVKGSD
jgi:hypothetical protein